MIAKTDFGAIGFGICNDMNYAQLWRQYAGKVDLILISSAWPENIGRLDIKLLRTFKQNLRDLPVKISEVLQVPTAYCNACHTCVGELAFNLGTLSCGGYSKIVNNGKVIAAVDSREERIIQGAVETSPTQSVPDPALFKNWIHFSFSEKIIWFLFETLAPYYCRVYYQLYKGKSR